MVRAEPRKLKGANPERTTMSKFECFVVNTAVESKHARELAQEWKAASPATRKAACKRMGDSFIISIIGSTSTFEFHADGSVKTINQTRSCNRTAPKYRKCVVDWNREIVGFAKGMPIYAK